MLCQNCGREIEDNSVFCPFCGTKCESTGSDGQTRQLNTLVLPNQLPQDNTDELNNHIDQQERAAIDSRSSRKLLVFIIISVCVALAALIAKPSWCRISLSDGACEELSLPWSEYPYYTVLIDAGDHVIGVRSGDDSYDGVAVYVVRPDGSGPTDYVTASAL